MNCPYFREGYFGICVAPDSVHVPAISEMESYCFRTHYGTCPHFSSDDMSGDNNSFSRVNDTSGSLSETKAGLHFAW